MLLETCRARESGHSSGVTDPRSCSRIVKPETTKPSTSCLGWSGKVVSGVIAPASSAAAAVSTFMIEPGT